MLHERLSDINFDHSGGVEMQELHLKTIPVSAQKAMTAKKRIEKKLSFQLSADKEYNHKTCNWQQ